MESKPLRLVRFSTLCYAATRCSWLIDFDTRSGVLRSETEESRERERTIEALERINTNLARSLAWIFCALIITLASPCPAQCRLAA